MKIIFTHLLSSSLSLYLNLSFVDIVIDQFQVLFSNLNESKWYKKKIQ